MYRLDLAVSIPGALATEKLPAAAKTGVEGVDNARLTMPKPTWLQGFEGEGGAEKGSVKEYLWMCWVG